MTLHRARTEPLRRAVRASRVAHCRPVLALSARFAVLHAGNDTECALKAGKREAQVESHSEQLCSYQRAEFAMRASRKRLLSAKRAILTVGPGCLGLVLAGAARDANGELSEGKGTRSRI